MDTILERLDVLKDSVEVVKDSVEVVKDKVADLKAHQARSTDQLANQLAVCQCECN
jgi:hypothetical protein